MAELLGAAATFATAPADVVALEEEEGEVEVEVEDWRRVCQEIEPVAVGRAEDGMFAIAVYKRLDWDQARLVGGRTGSGGVRRTASGYEQCQ